MVVLSQYFQFLMSIGERVVVLTIIKLFNWNQKHGNSLFQLSFSSTKTGSHLHTKTVQAKLIPPQVIFNYSLRVAYQPDQNQVSFRLARFNQRNQEAIAICEVVINLHQLAHKKVMLFTFGKNDTVLKIGIGQQEKQQQKRPVIPQRNESNNQQFIREKQDFLKRVGTISSTTTHKANSSSSSLILRTRSLLSEIKGIKQQQGPQKLNHQSHLRGTSQLEVYDQNDKVRRSRLSDRGLFKSSSEGYFNSWNSQRNSKLVVEDSHKGSRKHHLVLNNLEMIPNQYYTDFDPKPYQESKARVNPKWKQKRLSRAMFQ